MIDYATRHIIKPGRLGRVRTIHFARWVLIGGTERLGFFSNYDGGNESYMDDFINKLGFGLNFLPAMASAIPEPIGCSGAAAPTNAASRSSSDATPC